jgi:alpha-N-arabinofuranosidase
MKKGIFILSMALIHGLTLCMAQNEAVVKVDVERQIGQIDNLMYSGFAEHLGRCVYQGIYDPASPKSDANGFRTDVIKEVKELNVPLVRWPGGNFASGYHWMDGIGPKEKRPVRMDLAWGKREDNSFGTDEFMAWCHQAGVIPYFCVNLGTGTAEEAHNWVEYCNVDGGTYYSDLRARNGHKKPYKIIYWGLGNEVDGPWQIGHKNAEDYSKAALETAKVMKWVDKDIKLIAAGCSNYGADWVNWNRTVINTLGDHADYLSLHNYVSNNTDDYYRYMASTDFADNVIKVTKGLILEAQISNKLHHPLYIAFDEYNASYNTKSHGGAHDTFNLEDALCVASYLNAFVRHADIVRMTNMAQIVNLLGPIATTNEKTWRQTIFYPLQLFANNCFGQSLSLSVSTPVYSIDNADQPYVDASSAFNPDKKTVVVNVVNRHKEQAMPLTLVDQNDIWGKKATACIVNGKTTKSMNTPEEENVKTRSQAVEIKNGKIKFPLEPHSFTQFIISLR